MYALEVNHLFKSYRTRGKEVTVLQDVSFKIGRGEMIAVMGKSGSGKTTLLHNLSGIDVPDSGEILINGQNLDTFSSSELALFRREHFGMVFQDFQLLESLSVKENILLPMILNGRKQQEQEMRLENILALTGLQELSDRGITELSGGQKQRTAIARAFIQEPEFIFADEPTGNLDAETTKGILHCMADLNQRTKASMVIVTHDPYVASFCHRLLRLEDGGIRDDAV